MALSMNNYRNTVLAEIADKMIADRGVKTIDLAHVTDNVEAGTGTYADLAKAYAGGKISLLRRGDDVVGISYESGAKTHAEDEIAGMRFAKKYSGLNVMGYIDSIIKAKLAGKEVAGIEESIDSPVIEITYTDGTAETIRKSYYTPCARDDEDDDDDYYDEEDEDEEDDPDDYDADLLG